MNQPLSSPVQCSVWLRAALWSHTGPNSYLPDGPASQECISNSVNSTYSPFQFLIPPDDGSSCLIGSRFPQSIRDSRPPPSGNKCFLVLHLCREIGRSGRWPAAVLSPRWHCLRNASPHSHPAPGAHSPWPR